ncbi:MAG: M1 family metallopeptidase, partial [Chitinophagaceae bacterium]
AYQDMAGYFRFAESGNDHPLVWYYYKNKEDVFDDVAYQKGGCILRMLRDYVGDSAFFESLHYYLEQNKFHPASAQKLRIAFQHVTGIDLNWFWNQWYYGEGYPKLDVNYDYNDALNLVHVIVKQTQEGKVFELPFAIDIYTNGKKERHKVVMMDRIDTFTYHYTTKPDLINVDGDKVLLAQIDDHKTIENYVYEYYHAGLYMDRRDAIEACAKVQDSNNDARNLLLAALNDKFYGLRILAIHSLDLENEQIRQMAEPVLKKLISEDKYSSVRATALAALTKENPQDYHSLITETLKDSSLLMESTALRLLDKIDTEAAYQQAIAFEQSAESPLTQVVCAVLV